MLYIYGLIDPRTKLIRYVGLATNIHRPLQHLRDEARTHKTNWIKDLLGFGLSYDVCVLETCTTVEDLRIAEIWWIAYGRACGWPLTNATDGGDGHLNPTPEAREKISFAMSSRIIGQHTREKMRENALGNQWHLGHTVSEEGRDRISASLLGKTLTEEHRRNISNGVRIYPRGTGRARKTLNQRIKRQLAREEE